MLGYLDADNFLGGRMRLDRDLAMRGARASSGGQLGMEPEEVAVGVFRIINSQMADLIRKSTIEQGHDPRECVLVAYGGAGPTHAVFYGHEIGSKAILVLADSTVFSAEGMLTCDITHTAEVSRVVGTPFTPESLAALTPRFEALERRVMDQFEAEGAPAAEVSLARTLGVRFRQQVQARRGRGRPGGARRVGAGERVLERFVDALRSGLRRGRAAAGRRQRGRAAPRRRHARDRAGRLPRTRAGAAPTPPPRSRASATPTSSRRGSSRRASTTGTRCAPATSSTGPAIIERMGDSVVVPPDFRAEVDPLLTIRLGALAAAGAAESANGQLEASR